MDEKWKFEVYCGTSEKWKLKVYSGRREYIVVLCTYHVLIPRPFRESIPVSKRTLGHHQSIVQLSYFLPTFPHPHAFFYCLPNYYDYDNDKMRNSFYWFEIIYSKYYLYLIINFNSSFFQFIYRVDKGKKGYASIQHLTSQVLCTFLLELIWYHVIRFSYTYRIKKVLERVDIPEARERKRDS